MSVTPLYAGLLSILFFILSYRVIQLRRMPGGASLGDGGNTMLARRIRAHGNFAEYVPLILLMLGLLELSHVSGYLLHGLGLTLLIARLLHGYSLSFSQSFRFGRFWGTVLTFLVLVVSGVLCIYQAFQA